MALTLAEMRAKLKEADERKNKFQEGGDNASYPFWNIPDNSTAVIRFLPDADDSNGWFWVERMVIKMPFPGVKGGDATKPITVQVPCMEMYGKTCPVMEEIKSLGWWKGSEDEQELARTYYKKRSYLYQGFVVTSPIKEEKTPENPIRRLVINKSIHDKIKASLMDVEIEKSPIDFNEGLDFKIIKTKQGKFANYDTSSFSRKTRPLNDEERAAIETHGLFNLRSFLPKEPDEKTLKLIMELFESSVNNELFDAEKFKAFRPNGATTSTGETSTDTDDDAVETKATVTTKATATSAKTEETVEPTVTKLKSTTSEKTTESASPKKSPADVLALLRQKKAEQQKSE